MHFRALEKISFYMLFFNRTINVVVHLAVSPDTKYVHLKQIKEMPIIFKKRIFCSYHQNSGAWQRAAWNYVAVYKTELSLNRLLWSKRSLHDFISLLVQTVLLAMQAIYIRADFQSYARWWNSSQNQVSLTKPTTQMTCKNWSIFFLVFFFLNVPISLFLSSF